MRQCKIQECNRIHFCKGYCRRHYERWKHHGHPNICLKAMSPHGMPMAWLRAHAEYGGEECLVWPFARFPDGRAHMKSGKPSRFMCALAHGPAPSRKHEAAHSCGNGHKACVSPNHLRWATKAENEADKLRHGTIAKGDRLPQAKLTDEAVQEIRALKGKMFQRDIAAKFSVQIACVNKILNGKSWRHVE